MRWLAERRPLASGVLHPSSSSSSSSPQRLHKISPVAQNVPSETRNQRTLLTLNPNTEPDRHKQQRPCCVVFCSSQQHSHFQLFSSMPVPTSSQTKLVRGDVWESLSPLCWASSSDDLGFYCKSLGGGERERARVGRVCVCFCFFFFFAAVRLAALWARRWCAFFFVGEVMVSPYMQS